MQQSFVEGDQFPDFEFQDHRGRRVRLSGYTRPTGTDVLMDLTDGYPLIVTFYRGYFCPRDGAHLRELVRWQEQLAVNYCKLVAVSVDPWVVCSAYRYGLGATFPFLSDESREAIDRLNIRDRTEGEFPGVAVPHTFVLKPDLTVHRVYYGWYFVGRPSVDELRRDLREVMSERAGWDYDIWEEGGRLEVMIPAEKWLGEGERPGSDRPWEEGQVLWFAVNDGYGMISADDGSEVLLHFTGIPGLGYRTLPRGLRVRFKRVMAPGGQDAAVDIQAIDEGGEPIEDALFEGSLTESTVAGMNL